MANTTVVTMTMSGYDDGVKALSSLNLSDLLKGIWFKNYNKQTVIVTGQKASYGVLVKMGLGFDDITQSFSSIKDLKDYIKRNIA